MQTFKFEQYTPEWYEIRRGIPTASTFGKILTPKTGKLSAQANDLICELIAEKFHIGSMEELSTPTSFAMRQGTEREPDARAWYEFERSADVTQVGFCLSDCGRYGCSPDGLVGDDGVLELKCPMGKTHVGYLLEGTLPSEYLAQCHGHLIVTGRAWCDFLSYSPGLPSLLVRVEADEYTAKLRDALEQFCAKYAATLAELEEKTGVTLAAA